MFTVSTGKMTVRSGGLPWLKPVAIVLPMLCSAVLAEWLPLKPCRVKVCGMLLVMHGSSVSAITERSEMGLHKAPMFMSLPGLGIGMMSASLHA